MAARQRNEDTQPAPRAKREWRSGHWGWCDARPAGVFTLLPNSFRSAQRIKDVSRPNSGHSPNLRLKAFCPCREGLHLNETPKPGSCTWPRRHAPPPGTPPLPHRGAGLGRSGRGPGNLTWRQPELGFPRGARLLSGRQHRSEHRARSTASSPSPKFSARWDFQKRGPLETHPDRVPARRSFSPTSASGHSPAPTRSPPPVSPTEGSPRLPGAARRAPKTRSGGDPHWCTRPAGTAPNRGGQFALCPGARARGPCPRVRASRFPRRRVGGNGSSRCGPRLPPAVTTHLLFKG